jgi:hypothetical protein
VLNAQVILPQNTLNAKTLLTSNTIFANITSMSNKTKTPRLSTAEWAAARERGDTTASHGDRANAIKRELMLAAKVKVYPLPEGLHEDDRPLSELMAAKKGYDIDPIEFPVDLTLLQFKNADRATLDRPALSERVARSAGHVISISNAVLATREARRRDKASISHSPAFKINVNGL